MAQRGDVVIIVVEKVKQWEGACFSTVDGIMGQKNRKKVARRRVPKYEAVKMPGGDSVSKGVPLFGELHREY